MVIELSVEQKRYLARLKDSGLFGNSLEETAERLIDEAILRRIRDGTMDAMFQE